VKVLGNTRKSTESTGPNWSWFIFEWEYFGTISESLTVLQSSVTQLPFFVTSTRWNFDPTDLIDQKNMV
jgi:hypothetical protein